MYVVICRDDDQEGKPGPYVATTRTVFGDADVAAKHAAGVAASREPRIVSPDEYLRECLGWRTE